MKKIIVEEKQFNMLYGLMVNEYLDKDVFNLGKKYLIESIGIPNNLIILNQMLCNEITSSIKNGEFEKEIKLNGEFDDWKLNYMINFDNKFEGVTYDEIKQINLTISVDSKLNVDKKTLSNILSHELMHVYQIKLGSNTILSNDKSSDIYRTMIAVFETYKNQEMHPLVLLNYIIYYSFKEEQEAYTVGGREYFENIELQHDMTNSQYIEILKNSPYHVVFLRLGQAQSILNNMDFFGEHIDTFCKIFDITYEKLREMLNLEIKTFRYKFDRVICDFCERNDISMNDRLKFYY